MLRFSDEMEIHSLQHDDGKDFEQLEGVRTVSATTTVHCCCVEKTFKLVLFLNTFCCDL
jgi:hypothetical protein